MFRSVLASRASEGQGGGSAQGLNRMGAGIGGGSGQLESIEGPGRCSGRCSGGQTEMGEDLGNHGGMLDGGDDLQGATALGALLDVDLEHSFTKALPGFRPSGRRSPFKTAPGGFVSSRAQLMEAGAAGGGTSAWSAEGVLALTGTFGTMSGRSLALRPRRAKQAPPWAWLRARARHGSGSDATADGEPARRVVV